LLQQLHAISFREGNIIFELAFDAAELEDGSSRVQVVSWNFDKLSSALDRIVQAKRRIKVRQNRRDRRPDIR
jgi:hypothetical protein